MVGDPARDWALVLNIFAPDDRRRAEAAVAQIRQMGVPAARLEDRGRFLAAVGGYYRDPASPQARAELERVRTIQQNGRRPFQGAVLAPPLGVSATTEPGEYDLRQARRRYGDAALYTLQVAAYGPAPGDRVTEAERAQFRAAAEQAASVLRQEGEMAFYYHGPHMSMVTVGVFGSGDVDYSRMYESPRLRDARSRHQYNLVNGRTVTERRAIDSPMGSRSVEKQQPSQLVRIPEG